MWDKKSQLPYFIYFVWKQASIIIITPNVWFLFFSETQNEMFCRMFTLLFSTQYKYFLYSEAEKKKQKGQNTLKKMGWVVSSQLWVKYGLTQLLG